MIKKNKDVETRSLERQLNQVKKRFSRLMAKYQSLKSLDSLRAERFKMEERRRLKKIFEEIIACDASNCINEYLLPITDFGKVRIKYLGH